MNRYLIFYVAGERLALKIRAVEDIVGLANLARDGDGTALLVHRAGAPLPIVDLRPPARNGTADSDDHYCVIVVEAEYEDGSVLLGLVVDGTAKTLEFDQADLPASWRYNERPGFAAVDSGPVARLLDPYALVPQASVKPNCRTAAVVAA